MTARGLWTPTAAGLLTVKRDAVCRVATVENGPCTTPPNATMKNPTVGPGHRQIVRDMHRNVRSPVVYAKVPPHILPTTATTDIPIVISSAMIQETPSIAGCLVEHAKI